MPGVAYPYAAIPARIALEREAWQEAANLPLYCAGYLSMEEISTG